MLSELDKLLCKQYDTVYIPLYHKLFQGEPIYHTLVKNDHTYMILDQRDTVVCMLSITWQDTSLVSTEIVVKELPITTNVVYDSKELRKAVICNVLILVHEHNLRKANKITLYTRQHIGGKGAVYKANEECSPLLLESLYHIAKPFQAKIKSSHRYDAKSLAKLSDTLLNPISKLVFDTDETEHIRKFASKLLGKLVLDVYDIGMASPIVISLEDKPTHSTICNYYGCVSGIIPVVAATMFTNEVFDKETYIHDTTGWCDVAAARLQDYLTLTNCICSIPVTYSEYRKLGDAICRI